MIDCPNDLLSFLFSCTQLNSELHFIKGVPVSKNSNMKTIRIAQWISVLLEFFPQWTGFVDLY